MEPGPGGIEERAGIDVLVSAGGDVREGGQSLRRIGVGQGERCEQQDQERSRTDESGG